MFFYFHVLSVSEMASGKVNRKYDEEILKKWTELLKESGITADYKISVGIPWLEIVETADKGDFSFVVLGSHRNYYLDKVFFGSVTENVIHHSSKPVFIFKLKLENINTQDAPFCIEIFKKIFFATDFSDASVECIPYIEQMLGNHNQELVILHVQES